MIKSLVKDNKWYLISPLGTKNELIINRSKDEFVNSDAGQSTRTAILRQYPYYLSTQNKKKKKCRKWLCKCSQQLTHSSNKFACMKWTLLHRVDNCSSNLKIIVSLFGRMMENILIMPTILNSQFSPYNSVICIFEQ